MGNPALGFFPLWDYSGFSFNKYSGIMNGGFSSMLPLTPNSTAYYGWGPSYKGSSKKNFVSLTVV